jgi:hypothetical protein
VGRHSRRAGLGVVPAVGETAAVARLSARLASLSICPWKRLEARSGNRRYRIENQRDSLAVAQLPNRSRIGAFRGPTTRVLPSPEDGRVESCPSAVKPVPGREILIHPRRRTRDVGPTSCERPEQQCAVTVVGERVRYKGAALAVFTRHSRQSAGMDSRWTNLA